MLRNGIITANFYDPRPLSRPGEHVHGAVDIVQGRGQSPLVYSLVEGTLVARVIRRPPQGAWASNEKLGITSDPVHLYFEDIYGGIITIEEDSGRYHILAHFYGSQLHKRFSLSEYTETIADSCWPVHMWKSKEVRVQVGEPLVNIGNAGYSTGPHLHWEIHHSRTLDPYSERLDPEVEYVL